jgi:hypothetical protein
MKLAPPDDHLVGAREQGGRHVDVERPGFSPLRMRPA